MSFIAKIENLAQRVNIFTEAIFSGIEENTKKVEECNSKLIRFFKDAYKNPIGTFKQVYSDISSYLKHKN